MRISGCDTGPRGTFFRDGSIFDMTGLCGRETRYSSSDGCIDDECGQFQARGEDDAWLAASQYQPDQSINLHGAGRNPP
jgi:hypothetical protein